MRKKISVTKPRRRPRPHHREEDARTFWTPAWDDYYPDNPDWVVGAN